MTLRGDVGIGGGLVAVRLLIGCGLTAGLLLIGGLLAVCWRFGVGLMAG
jgi:hypothetical protein